MKLFMTSTIGGYEMTENGPKATAMNNANGFAGMLREAVDGDIDFLMIAAYPDSFEQNDAMLKMTAASLELTGIELKSAVICDHRNASGLNVLMKRADLVILSGGHVPTENRFFTEIGLQDELSDFDGVLVGISAGTMNCASTVYAQPEEDGEAVDPNYRRWIDGLGLTEIRVLPHFQMLRDMSVDGLRIVEDISIPDSEIMPFYALVDGSFIMKDKEKTTLYGESYRFEDGKMKLICQAGESLDLDDRKGQQ